MIPLTVMMASVLVSFRPMDEHSLAVHVDTLVEQHDRLLVQVALHPQLEVAYACPYAGIVVFNSTDQWSASRLKHEVMRLLEAGAVTPIAFEHAPELEELKAQCTQPR